MTNEEIDELFSNNYFMTKLNEYILKNLSISIDEYDDPWANKIYYYAEMDFRNDYELKHQNDE